jgi:oligogalacturonide lyase
MIRKYASLFLPAVILLSSVAAAAQTRAPSQGAREIPREWVDPDTGHRVIRLSDEPGSASLYFHQNAYTPDGQKLIITTPTGLSTINLKTRQIERVVEGRVGVIVVGRKTGQVYYVKYNRETKPPTGVVYATDLNTKATREVVKLPPRASVSNINADETLLVGSITEGGTGMYGLPAGQAPPAAAAGQGGPPSATPPGDPAPGVPQRADSYPGKGEMMERRLAARIPMQLITINTETGEVKTLLKSTDWINHIQFSPADPTLIMFCHEGPWHKVDRTWLIRADGTGLTQVHHRTINMEIEGHEFFGGDGRWVWYDLQTPRSQVFWVGGYEVATGRRVWYNLQRSEWSVHYNVSPDGTLFAGDGGGPNSVAAPGNGQWIYLFRPQMVPDRTDGQLPNSKDLVQPGYFKAEKLVNLSKHDYSLEPNVTFTPDMKWLVFRSNMFGPTQVFAVEIEKSK